MPFEDDGRMIRQRLGHVEFVVQARQQRLHPAEHLPEHPQPAANLPRRKPCFHGGDLRLDVPGDRAEISWVAVFVHVYGEAWGIWVVRGNPYHFDRPEGRVRYLHFHQRVFGIWCVSDFEMVCVPAFAADYPHQQVAFLVPQVDRVDPEPHEQVCGKHYPEEAPLHLDGQFAQFVERHRIGRFREQSVSDPFAFERVNRPSGFRKDVPGAFYHSPLLPLRPIGAPA